MACDSTQGQDIDPIIYLQNDYIQAGFLPEVGGRMVFLGKPGGKNLLKADSTFWREAAEDRMTASPDAEWKAYQGHIIWVGPQSEWWIHQDLNTRRRDGKVPWPPDPFLVYADFKVLEKTEHALVLEGPASPVSGIQLIKKYTLMDSCLNIEVSMVNRSEKMVAWDIWSNARFDESATFFVPGCEKGVLRIDTNENAKSSGPKGEIIKSAFTFVHEADGAGKKGGSAKAFLHPEKGRIVAAENGCMLVMTFDFVARDKIHPEQGFVEIYKKSTPGGKDGLLELEHHSAYMSLQPGESHVLSVKWNLHDYAGATDLEDAISYYNTMNY